MQLLIRFLSVLVFVTLLCFISFSVYYSLRWKNRRRAENLNPFLVAQLTTIGEFQSTEYASDGIIVPKLFYKSKDAKSDKKENIDNRVRNGDFWNDSEQSNPICPDILRIRAKTMCMPHASIKEKMADRVKDPLMKGYLVL